MHLPLVPLFPAGGIPGGTELIVILLIAVLLFGANKIPKLARSTGQAMGEFQKGREQVEQELEEIKQGPSGGSDGETDAAGTEAGSGTASEPETTNEARSDSTTETESTDTESETTTTSGGSTGE